MAVRKALSACPGASITVTVDTSVWSKAKRNAVVNVLKRGMFRYDNKQLYSVIARKLPIVGVGVHHSFAGNTEWEDHVTAVYAQQKLAGVADSYYAADGRFERMWPDGTFVLNDERYYVTKTMARLQPVFRRKLSLWNHPKWREYISPIIQDVLDGKTFTGPLVD